MKYNECETWEEFYEEKNNSEKEKMNTYINTYVLEGHYYLTEDSRAKEVINEVVLAKSAEEAITKIKSFPLYRDAIIDRVELRDSNIIGNSYGE